MHPSPLPLHSPRNAAADRRQQLLDIGRKRFIADGYAATSVASIVGAAGVAQGTFYRYFPSKQALLTELRRGVFASYEQVLVEVAQQQAPADLKLALTVGRILEVLSENVPLERVFRAAESAEDTQRAALSGRARLARRAAAFVVEGKAQGCFSTEHPEAAARFIITLFYNVLYEALVYDKPGSDRRVAAQGLDFVLRGLGVPAHRAAMLAATLNPAPPCP